jgi:hypothetical protein
MFGGQGREKGALACGRTGLQLAGMRENEQSCEALLGRRIQLSASQFPQTIIHSLPVKSQPKLK